MEIPLYLAMTAAEFAFCDSLPQNCAWMACHFSPYGTGLTNLPEHLPAHSLIIVDDSTPIRDHDPGRISEQLCEMIDKHHPTGILLDFQRPNQRQAKELSAHLVESLPCPVCVSDVYAKDLDCPVFLPPPKLICRLKDHLLPWTGREIWLEAALGSTRFRVTSQGCATQQDSIQDLPFCDEELHCHYKIELTDDFALFSISRTREDLDSLLAEATSYRVTRAVGLWQELNRQESFCPNARLPNTEEHDKMDLTNAFEY